MIWTICSIYGELDRLISMEISLKSKYSGEINCKATFPPTPDAGSDSCYSTSVNAERFFCYSYRISQITWQ